MDNFKDYLLLLVLLGLYLYIGIAGIMRILKQAKSNFEQKKSIRNIVSITLALVGYIVLFITFILWQCVLYFKQPENTNVYIVIMFFSVIVAMVGVAISPNKFHF